MFSNKPPRPSQNSYEIKLDTCESLHLVTFESNWVYWPLFSVFYSYSGPLPIHSLVFVENL